MQGISEGNFCHLALDKNNYQKSCLAILLKEGRDNIMQWFILLKNLSVQKCTEWGLSAKAGSLFDYLSPNLLLPPASCVDECYLTVYGPGFFLEK